MQDPQDELQLHGSRRPAANESRPPETPEPAGRRFLSVWYSCCHVYGRLARTRDGTGYRGACPSCGRIAKARIGPGGTSQQIFQAY